jgi:hypothetical protein
LFPFTHKCYKPNLVEIGSAVPEKKLKNVQKFTDDVSDSGEKEKEI